MAPQHIEREVLRRLCKPRRGVPGDAVVGPRLERAHQRFLALHQLVGGCVAERHPGEIDAVHVAYTNFISTGMQRPEVLTILPLEGLKESLERIGLQVAEKEAQAKAGALDARRSVPDAFRELARAAGLEVVAATQPPSGPFVVECRPS